MSIKINYTKKKGYNPSSNLVLFSDNKLSPKNLKNFLSKSEFDYIQDLSKVSDPKKKLIVFELNSRKKIILISDTISFSTSGRLGTFLCIRYKNTKVRS